VSDNSLSRCCEFARLSNVVDKAKDDGRQGKAEAKEMTSRLFLMRMVTVMVELGMLGRR